MCICICEWMDVVYLHEFCYVLLLSEVEISFMEDTVMVNEGIGEISLQLQAEGIYTNGFRVSVSCLDIFPVEAKGK